MQLLYLNMHTHSGTVTIFPRPLQPQITTFSKLIVEKSPCGILGAGQYNLLNKQICHLLHSTPITTDTVPEVAASDTPR